MYEREEVSDVFVKIERVYTVVERVILILEFLDDIFPVFPQLVEQVLAKPIVVIVDILRTIAESRPRCHSVYQPVFECHFFTLNETRNPNMKQRKVVMLPLYHHRGRKSRA
jgi:hypothetical protein